jgi:hypothetical protein
VRSAHDHDVPDRQGTKCGHDEKVGVPVEDKVVIYRSVDRAPRILQSAEDAVVGDSLRGNAGYRDLSVGVWKASCAGLLSSAIHWGVRSDPRRNCRLRVRRAVARTACDPGRRDAPKLEGLAWPKPTLPSNTVRVVNADATAGALCGRHRGRWPSSTRGSRLRTISTDVAVRKPWTTAAFDLRKARLMAEEGSLAPPVTIDGRPGENDIVPTPKTNGVPLHGRIPTAHHDVAG